MLGDVHPYFCRQLLAIKIFILNSSLAGSVPVMYCNNPKSLQQCVEVLAQSAGFGVDLEFDSNRYGYGVTPSLIQLATPAACFVVDLMAGLDVSALFALLTNERIEKLLHTSGEDLRLLHRLGCYPQNLFDTEIVARLLNYEQTSLANLVAAKLSVAMSKKHQRCNWLLRPLSEEQIRYAADDVMWLHPLREALVAEAKEKGLMPYVREEQAVLSQTVYAQNTDNNFLKPADLLALSPWQQFLTNELFRYRDELARRLKRPPYQVMSEDVLRGLAAGNLSPRDTATHSGVHSRYRNHRGAAALSAQVERIKAAADAQGLSHNKPRRPRPTAAEQAAWRKAAEDREQLFLPIQQALKNRFGVYATQLLLSNKLISELLNGNVSLATLRPQYRAALFVETAESLGLDLRDYGAEAIVRK